ncbi:MAG: hypothetical protein OET90_06880, partial [Desulfuromonadales bacterium]|nr:hypothetical protein [Desulfuromonadales bacterium]
MLQSHATMLNTLVDHKRPMINPFIDEEWGPELREQVLENPAVVALWQEIQQTHTEQERQEVIDYALRIIGENIDDKRVRLFASLNNAETDVMRNIDSEYQQTLAIITTLSYY